MSSVDAAWLQMDSPTNLMTITGVLCFDETLDFARFKEVVEDRWLCHERMRQKVVVPRLPFTNPRWEDDLQFNLKRHLLRITLPSPGGQAELEHLVSTLMSTPLEFDISPWQFHVVDGYGSGSALIARIHHCIADGIALVRVLLGMAEAEHGVPAELERLPEDEPAATTTPQLVNEAAAAVRRIAHSVTKTGAAAILNPASTSTVASRTLAISATLGRLLCLPNDPKTVFKGSLGEPKICTWSQELSLAQVKAVSITLGITINDVLCAGVAGAMRRFIAARRHPTDDISIRAVVPVNLRPEGEKPSLGNRFGLVFLTLPIGIADQHERIMAVKRAMDTIKGSPQALVTYGLLSLLGMASPQIESIAVNIFGQKATGVMTNVPGPRQAISLAGSKVASIMFWVPQSGKLGLGISILSYAGGVRVGVVTDAGLVPDPHALVQAFEEEMSEIIERYLG